MTNYNYVNELDWPNDSSLNYDPVREAAAQNAAAGISDSNRDSPGRGSSQPQGGGENSSPTNIETDTDTKRLGDYFFQCGKGNSMDNCGLEDGSNHFNTTPQKLFLSRIWAHVKAEHPEFANNYIYDNNTTIINDTLLNNIYSLNKNYPGNWPATR